jgi:3-hydroxybutyryl-CoA dehydrogenase
MTNISFEDIVINFGFSSKEEKKKVLQENADKKVFMDLTCFDPEEFYAEFPQLKGSFAALFCDEGKKVEIHFKERDESVVAKLKELGFSPIQTSIMSCGFIFPRTIVQIINEAYFALAEGVADKEDINRAMKFGVNYPKGPFEWSQGREEYVLTLLQELHQKTQDKRYSPCHLLIES